MILFYLILSHISYDIDIQLESCLCFIMHIGDDQGSYMVMMRF